MCCNPLHLLISSCNLSSDFLSLKLWLKWSHDLGNSLDQKNLIISSVRGAVRSRSDKNSVEYWTYWCHVETDQLKKSPVVIPKPQGEY